MNELLRSCWPPSTSSCSSRTSARSRLGYANSSVASLQSVLSTSLALAAGRRCAGRPTYGPVVPSEYSSSAAANAPVPNALAKAAQGHPAGLIRRYLALQRAAGEFGFGASLTTHVEAGAAVVGEGQSGEPWVAAGCLGHFERTPDAASGDGDDWGGADADGLYEEARCASPWPPADLNRDPRPGARRRRPHPVRAGDAV